MVLLRQIFNMFGFEGTFKYFFVGIAPRKSPRKRLGEIERKWRNWYTRTSQKRMGQPLRVQVSPSAFRFSEGLWAIFWLIGPQ